MTTESPLHARCGKALYQQHLRFPALHADLVRCVDGAVERGLLTGVNVKRYAMQRNCPFKTTAKNMEIVSRLRHRGFLSHISIGRPGDKATA